MEKKVPHKAGRQPDQRQTGPQQAQDPNGQDSTKLMINFSLGLVFCCVVLGASLGIYLNFDHVARLWKSASVKVSDLLNKKTPPPPPPIKIEPQLQKATPDNHEQELPENQKELEPYSMPVKGWGGEAPRVPKEPRRILQ